MHPNILRNVFKGSRGGKLKSQQLRKKTFFPIDFELRSPCGDNFSSAKRSQHKLLAPKIGNCLGVKWKAWSNNWVYEFVVLADIGFNSLLFGEESHSLAQVAAPIIWHITIKRVSLLNFMSLEYISASWRIILRSDKLIKLRKCWSFNQLLFCHKSCPIFLFNFHIYTL